ncbi:MAG: CPBP family intramembrane metalloprotease [Victivallaceae bacterium]|nr:CPBP family intramembrane metalloprotease [Victivallaceae bacterium]
MNNRDIATIEFPPPTPSEQPEDLSKWLNWSFATVILLISIVYILPRILYTSSPPDPATISVEQLAGMLFSAPILFALTLFPIAIFLAPQINLLGKLKLDNLKLLHIPIAATTAIAAFFCCAIISAGNDLILEILNIETTAPFVPILAKACSDTNFILIVFAVIIVAPITEEIVFRRIIYSWLNKYVSKWSAIIITSALFAIIHDSFAMFAALFFLGICFQLIYLKYNSLFTAIIMHSCFNSITAIILLLIRMGLITMPK